jgi:hypothetical protein
VRDEVHEEFDFHLDMRTDELIRSGLTKTDARAQALKEFGNLESGTTGVCHARRPTRATPLG